MTNLEKYQKILKENLNVKEEDFNDETLIYNRYPRWDSVVHLGMVTELEEKFGVSFDTLDITSFGTYTKGIEILEKLGVDMNC